MILKFQLCHRNKLHYHRKHLLYLWTVIIFHNITIINVFLIKQMHPCLSKRENLTKNLVNPELLHGRILTFISLI